MFFAVTMAEGVKDVGEISPPFSYLAGAHFTQFGSRNSSRGAKSELARNLWPKTERPQPVPIVCS